MAEKDRATQIAELLTVTRARARWAGQRFAWLRAAVFEPAGVGLAGRRHYREARLAVGDPVTIVGMVLPFDQLADPNGSDAMDGGLNAAGSDPEIAADLAAAQATGSLAASPEQAWGNAAIPGFGIGRPVRAPTLDPAARPSPLASAAEAAQAQRTFDITPNSLILACGPEMRLLVTSGTPAVAAQRADDRFLVGLLGAVSRDRLRAGAGLAGQRRAGHLMPYVAAAAFAALIVLVLFGFLAFATYNEIVALTQRIDKAWANIDVTLKQRFDELPNLVSAVRGVMGFEQDVLTEVTRLRNAYSGDVPVPEQAATSGGDQPGGPPAVRDGRELPEPEVGDQRARAAGRDPAARGRDRRPARAVQRLGGPLQHPDPAGPGGPPGRPLRLELA